MTLAIGTKLAHYEILEPIGKGGMGEVYRAKDSKLGRDVAIKVLPDEFAQDEERLRRFQREAKVLASLNHPNIASIYGLEHSGDTHYLVLELVPGETLAERIARGPIPVEEALDIAKKIAAALEEAHEQGIVHRDLKPANVKLTPDEKVKVLDFGLAKAFVEEGAEGDAATSLSPTITRDATRIGVILGTAAYMSPEQAKGKPVDKRTDIFAFGAVLYEMVSGQRAFAGNDVAETLAAVIRAEPDFEAIPAETPVAAARMLRLCLVKDPKRRARDIGDVGLGLDGAFHSASGASATPVAGAMRVRYLTLAVVLGALLGGVALFTLRSNPEPPRVVRYSIEIPEPRRLLFDGIALHPDGSRIAFVQNEQIYLRSLDTYDATPLPGTSGNPDSLAFSPDGTWLAFSSQDTLKKISLDGGVVTTIAEHEPLGTSWGEDDKLRFGTFGGVWEVDASDGTAQLVVATEGFTARRPQLLPDGRTILFARTEGVMRPGMQSSIVIHSPGDDEPRVLIENSSMARYLSTGHIVFSRGSSGQLFAQPFDPATATLSGIPVPVVNESTPSFAVSRDGTLVYRRSEPPRDSRLVWVDRAGNVIAIVDERSVLARPHLAPNGRRVAIERGVPKDIWVYDLERGTSIRATANDVIDREPVWMPDGERFVFSSLQDGIARIHMSSADGSGEPTLLLSGEVDYDPHSVSADGRTLALYSNDSDDRDIWTLDLEALGEPAPFVVTEFNERSPSFSPDGRFIAYASDASGQDEIYVQPYPGPGTRTIVSTDGGRFPVWSRDGTELFYREARNENRMMVVAVETGPSFRAGTPELLFEAEFQAEGSTRSGSRSFDVNVDGERFLMVQRARPRPELRVVVNWFEELKRLVPTN